MPFVGRQEGLQGAWASADKAPPHQVWGELTLLYRWGVSQLTHLARPFGSPPWPSSRTPAPQASHPAGLLQGWGAGVVDPATPGFCGWQAGGPFLVCSVVGPWGPALPAVGGWATVQAAARSRGQAWPSVHVVWLGHPPLRPPLTHGTVWLRSSLHRARCPAVASACLLCCAHFTGVEMDSGTQTSFQADSPRGRPMTITPFPNMIAPQN